MAGRQATVEAMILAAGEGTRLRPLSFKKPKPLFPVCNVPLLALTLQRLRDAGFRRLLLNTHHLADQIQAFVQAQTARFPDLQIETRYEPEILGTGGGLKNSETFWQEDFFLVVNGDILWDLDLAQVIQGHLNHGGPITLVLHDYPASNNILLADDGTVSQFRVPEGNRTFTGIQVLRREIFSHLPPAGAYDIIPVYQRLIDMGVPIRASFPRVSFWRDMGTPLSYRELNREVVGSRIPVKVDFPGRTFERGRSWCIHPLAQIEPGVRLEGWGVIGEGCRIKRGCLLRNSILWKNVRVWPGTVIEDSVIGDGLVVRSKILSKMVC